MDLPCATFAPEHEQLVVAFSVLSPRGEDARATGRGRPSPGPVARTLHLDGKQALAIMRESMAYSRIMDTKGEKMLRGDFKPQARLSQHLKDVRLMIAAAKDAAHNVQ